MFANTQEKYGFIVDLHNLKFKVKGEQNDNNILIDLTYFMPEEYNFLCSVKYKILHHYFLIYYY